MGLALIVLVFLALIFGAVGAQTCIYHPELAGTPQYQECHFRIAENWPFLALAVAALVVAALLVRRKPS